VIYCGGNDPEQVARECYDRKTIELPDVQRDAVLSLAEARPDFVFIIVSSYTYAMPFTDKRPGAILWTSHAGPELGHAVEATLFGDNNPAGRTPVTWYECDEDLGDIKDYDIMKNKMTYRWFEGNALYPFGHGLSYSSFSYSNVNCSVNKEEIIVSADIKNDGNYDGDEVVQLYYRPVSKRIRRPLKQLCGFKRISVCAGESAHVEIAVPLRELEFYDVSRQRFCLESGDYEIMVGASSADIRSATTVSVCGKEIPPRDFSEETEAQLYDRERNTEIYIDPISAESHVRGLRWVNILTYQNVDFNDVKRICVKASAVVSEKNITVLLDDCKEPLCELAVPASDGYTDFRDLTAELDISGCHDLTLSFGENISIKSIKLNK
ncbi:MAG: glycoside hydrolase family 3 C-terminal domain-containing protein, partial [Oscillospiraceae bacterium]|nr:glycoside hydrolase family 3 C-terminal domain-containing protein [Oscillospiraceae bacterium]